MRKIPTLLCLIVSSSLPGQDNGSVIDKANDLILNSRFADALELLEHAEGESPSLLIANKKAEALTQLGRLDDAEEVLLAALPGAEQRTTAHSHEVAQALSTLGIVYMSQGKYAQAQEQLHRALSIREKQEHNREALVAASYNDLGLAYSQTDKDRALDYYEQAHKMYVSLYGENDPRIAISNINTGVIYRDLELFGDAVTNFENALSIWNLVYEQPHPAKAIALYNLGQTYLRLNDQKAASDFYQRALKMYHDSYGPLHPEISSVLNAMGNLATAQGKFDEALRHYQDAVKANVQHFDDGGDLTANPSLKSYYNGTALLHTLLFKAQAFEGRYTRKSLKFSDLRNALRTLTACDSLIDQLRHHSTNESDKLQLGVMANEVYADGVRIAYLAGLNAVKKDEYFEMAFYFAEKSKGAVLLESISDAEAKAFAGIPPELLEQEKELKSAISVTARKLAAKPAEDEERVLRETAFGLKREYDSFVERLERDYPAYFDLKYNAEAPSTTEIRAMLPDHTALISYFIDDKNDQLYTFLLRNSQYKVWQKPMTADFDRYITGLRNGLYFQEIHALKTSAYQLGKTLLPPIPASVTDLVIIPTGRLGLIPFETLLTGPADDIADYASFPWLLKRFSIRYELSAGVLTQKKDKAASTAPASIFLCAPVNFPHKTDLNPLPGTEQEVRAISELFADKNYGTHVLLRDQASEQQIKSGSLKGFQYLHFATHGIVDERQPELSRLFLLEDAGNDGDLFAGEIYNLELNANLVTLSACQTGLGKLMKGEGVIGLSRALVYAGALHIMVSFWSVADESTAIMMKDFYKDLLESDSDGYSQALRRSKLKLMSVKNYSAPYYWAPFVLVGF